MFSQGFSNNRQVRQAASGVNASAPANSADVIADSDYINFVNAISSATANASTQVVGEKFVVLARNSNNDVIVLRAGILPPNGGRINISGAGVVAHVHYQGLEQRPGPGDHHSVKSRNIPGFVINHNGSRVWEVGRVAGVGGTYDYRTVHGASPGRWRRLRGAR